MWVRDGTVGFHWCVLLCLSEDTIYGRSLCVTEASQASDEQGSALHRSSVMFGSCLFNGLLSKSDLPALSSRDSESGIKSHHFSQAVKSSDEEPVATAERTWPWSWPEEEGEMVSE